MLSLAEVGSWFTFLIFAAHRRGVDYPAVGMILAIIVYLGLNITHAVLHSKKMIANTPKEYKKLILEYKAFSWTIRIISYSVSFKFSLLLLSYLFMRP